MCIVLNSTQQILISLLYVIKINKFNFRDNVEKFREKIQKKLNFDSRAHALSPLNLRLSSPMRCFTRQRYLAIARLIHFTIYIPIRCVYHSSACAATKFACAQRQFLGEKLPKVASCQPLKITPKSECEMDLLKLIKSNKY